MMKKTIVGFFLIATFLAADSAYAAVEKVRAMFREDPATSFVVGWNQLSGDDAMVCWDTTDHGDNAEAYPYCQSPDRSVPSFLDMNTNFVRLTGLTPDTKYYFVINDSEGESSRYYVLTAPDQPETFTYIVGGDTKSSGSALEAGRRSNEMVSRLRPLFVLFNGDFNSDNGTNPDYWDQWLDDWSSGSTTTDGRLTPFLAVHGNHENGNYETLNNLFDTPATNGDPYSYYALTFGGSLLKVIALNSELQNGSTWADAFDRQTLWLTDELAESIDMQFVIAGYHKPLRPHTSSKAEQPILQNTWVPLFDNYGVTLGCEGDSHMHKITFPVSYCTDGSECFQNFERNDVSGVMYVGEGSWGASPRVSDDNKPWTINSRSMNQIKWCKVTPDDPDTYDVDEARLEIRTVITTEDGEEFVSGVEALTEANKYTRTPDNINLLELPFFGEAMTMPFERPVGDVPSPPINLALEVLSFTEINVTWDNVSGTDEVANIELQMKEGEGQLASFETLDYLPADATYHKVIQLKAGETYTFRNRAVNLFGPSEWSNEVGVSIPVDTRLNVSFMQGCNQDGICYDPVMKPIFDQYFGITIDCDTDFYGPSGACVDPVTDIYTGAVDAGLIEEQPDLVDDGTDLSIVFSEHGGYNLMVADNNSGHGDRFQSLIRFNGIEALIPENAVIDQALLRFITGDDTDSRISVHRMLIDWPIKPTWNTFGDEGVELNDVEAALDADDSEFGNIPFAQPVFFDITESVKAWVDDPEKNFGLVIVNSGSNGWDTPQSEFFAVFDAALVGGTGLLRARPQLTVYYTIPGDLTQDGLVNREDVQEIRSFLRQPASVCPECDMDGDGRITVRDARKLVRMCDCDRCVCPE
jgi:hypothetical protein